MINNRHSLLIAILALSCAACGSDDGNVPSSSYYDSNGPRTEYQKVGKPYQVKGQWYTPKYETDYDETGLASWYGDYFHGRSTSNGEKFDMNRISAAHKTLPLPSYVEVTNLDNGRKLYVRVNDRGPFVDDRIIDLSKKAAEMLGSKNTGLARVRVRQVDPPKNVVLVAPDGSKTHGKGYDYNSKPTPTMLAQAKTATPVPVSSGIINDMPASNQKIQSTQVALYDRNLFPSDKKATTTTQSFAPVTVAGYAAPKLTATAVTVSNPAPVQQIASNTPVTVKQQAYTQPNPDIIANILKEHQNSVVYGNAGTPSAPASNYQMQASNNTNSLITPASPQNLPRYKVQVGVFASQDNVNKLREQLQPFGAVNVTNRQTETKLLSSVSLGPYDNLQKAQETINALDRLGINGAGIVSD